MDNGVKVYKMLGRHYGVDVEYAPGDAIELTDKEAEWFGSKVEPMTVPVKPKGKKGKVEDTSGL